MPTSVRSQIMSAVSSALSDVVSGTAYTSTISYVSESIKAYNEVNENQFPACFPIDMDESREYQTLSGPADKSADLTVIVTSMLFSRSGVTSTDRGNLLRDIEKAMVTASQITAISQLWMVDSVKVTTDQGTIPMYSIHDQEVHFHYYYQSTDGG